MINKIILIYVKIGLRIRWVYFHIMPRYVKFYMESGGEAYFQDMKLNVILCDYKVIKPDNNR